MTRKKPQPDTPMQLALFTDESASSALSHSPVPATLPMTIRVVHHHMKVWFRDFSPPIVYCSENCPTFDPDNVWSCQFMGRCGYLFEDCCICNPLYNGLMPDYLPANYHVESEHELD